jgi:hypothetical protein
MFLKMKSTAVYLIELIFSFVIDLGLPGIDDCSLSTSFVLGSGEVYTFVAHIWVWLDSCSLFPVILFSNEERRVTIRFILEFYFVKLSEPRSYEDFFLSSGFLNKVLDLRSFSCKSGINSNSSFASSAVLRIDTSSLRIRLATINSTSCRNLSCSSSDNYAWRSY